MNLPTKKELEPIDTFQSNSDIFSVLHYCDRSLRFQTIDEAFEKFDSAESKLEAFVSLKILSKMVEEINESDNPRYKAKIANLKDQAIKEFLTRSGGATSSKDIIPGINLQIRETKSWIYPEEIVRLQDEYEEAKRQLAEKKAVLDLKIKSARADGSAQVEVAEYEKDGEAYLEEISEKSLVVRLL